jgi:hypothetical protein
MFSGSNPFSLTLLVAALATLACPVAAQGMREDDQILSIAELDGALSGQIVEFYDGSKARYMPDRGYSYTYQEGDPPFVGTYEPRDDSQVCVEFDNGLTRCDMYVMAGEHLVLIIADGTRFPVRTVTPLSQ